MSDGPFLCFRELVPPTCVEASAFFSTFQGVTGEREEYLCTATCSTLSIRKIIDVQNVDDLSSSVFFDCFHTKLFGKPQSIQVVHNSHSDDLLLISLDSGKFLLLKYNTVGNDLTTLWMCNAEEKAVGVSSEVHSSELSLQSLGASINPCITSINHEGDVACSVMYGQHLLVIPLSPGVLNNSSESLSPLSTTSHHFLIDVHSTLHLVGPIIDCCFVSGYSKPTVAILQESGLLPIGHAAKVRNTCTLTVLAFDTVQKSAVVIWQQDKLPHDSVCLIQQTSSLLRGVVGLVSLNAVLLVSQEKVIGMAANGFADVTVSGQVDLQPWPGQEEGLELDASRWSVEYSSSAESECNDKVALIGSLKDGRLIRVGVVFTSSEYLSLSNVVLVPEILASSVRCRSFAISAHSDLWFLGSAHSDSLLLHVHREERGVFSFSKAECAYHFGPDNLLLLSESQQSPLSKRQRRLTNNFMDAGGDPLADHEMVSVQHVSRVEEEEILLYGTILSGVEERSLGHVLGNGMHRNVESVPRFAYHIRVVDSVAGLGPVLDAAFCRPDSVLGRIDSIDWQNRSLHSAASAQNSSNSVAAYVAEKESKDCWQVCAGLDEGAAVYHVHSGLSLAKISARNFAGAQNIFSLVGGDTKGSHSTLVVSYADSSRVFHCVEAGKKSSSSTPELKIKEIPESGLTLSTNTLFAGLVSDVGGEQVAVQVFPQGLRVVKLGRTFGADGTAVQEVVLSDDVELGGLGGVSGEVLVTGDVSSGGWVAVLSSLGNVFALQYDSAAECLELREKRICAAPSPSQHVVDDSGDVMELDSTVQETALSKIVASTPVSISLFTGVFRASASTTGASGTTSSDPTAKESLSLEEQEEVLLYGKALSMSESDSNSNSNSGRANVYKEVHSAAALLDEDDDWTEETHLVVSEASGAVSIVRLSDMKCVFRTLQFAQLENTVRGGSENICASHVADRQIVETRLARLGPSSGPAAASRLCFMALFHSGDLVTYCSSERADGAICAWNKVDYRSVCNKRAHKLKLKRSVSLEETSVALLGDSQPDSTAAPTVNGSADQLTSGAPGGSTFDFSGFLNSEEYQHRSVSLSYISELSGRSGILVSANRALFVAGGKGIPSIIPLSFPEISCVNYGHHTVVPFAIGRMRALAALWTEQDDAEAVKGAALSKTRTATMGVYQEVADLCTFPLSTATVRKVSVGKTVHRFAEILNKTDDKTERALLEKRTFVMACSEEARRPFIPTVLTADEMAKEDVLYERYLPTLDSFCQPNEELGAAPQLLERAHMVSIVQGGAAVDTYEMPLGERVLDMQVVYLNIEHTVLIPGFMAPMKTAERRVFVVACTSVADRRGEDSQGAGRLLLFGLDYALFQENSNALESAAGDSFAAALADEKAVSTFTAALDKVADGVDGDGVSEMDVAKDDETTATKTAISASAAAPAKATAQDKFLGAIQPKLRLLWSGPGPASVVRQIGDFILSTVGSTAFIYRLNSETMELEQVAFHFAQFFITSVSVIKNLVVLADMYHSVQFLLWREEDFSLHLVSKDFDDMTVLTSAFLHDGNKLGMLLADDEGNLQLMQQNPKKVESNKGTRLLCLADFHVGSDVSMMVAHDLLSPEPAKKPIANPLDNRPPPPPPRSRKGSSFPLQPYGARFNKSNPGRSCVLLGTMDGGLGMVVPLDERMYRRLMLLQQILTMTVQAPLALNPKDFRQFKTSRFRLSRKKGVLDGNLLWTFLSLHPTLQEELASAVGTTAYTVKENLYEIECLSGFF